MSNKRGELYFIDNFRLNSTDTETKNYKTSSKWPAVTFVQSNVIVIIMKCAGEIFGVTPTPTTPPPIRMKYFNSPSTQFCKNKKKDNFFIFRRFVGKQFSKVRSSKAWLASFLYWKYINLGFNDEIDYRNGLIRTMILFNNGVMQNECSSWGGGEC